MLGKTTFSKICNSVALVLLLGYTAVKVFPLLGIEVAAEIVSKEVVVISSSDLLTHEALQEKLSTFRLDQSKLAAALSGQMIQTDEFFKEVQMDYVVPSDLATKKKITIEFITESPKSGYAAGYKNIAEQVSLHLNG